MDELIREDVKKIVAELETFREKISGKTFLVTGGAGFLGSWFCDVLDFFNAKIICVDNLVSGHSKNIEHLMKKENFTFLNSDILNYNHDEKIKLDYIVHMASIATPPLYMEHPVETLDTNILGTKKLLELSKEHSVKGFLFMSTSEIYGSVPDNFVPTKENFYGFTNSFGPRSMYDEGKRAAEAYCYSYFKKFNLPIRIVRIFNTFGPRLDVNGTSQYGRAIIKFIFQALNNQVITVHGDGKQTRSFCYVTDQIVGLFKVLLTPGIDGEVFNIGNDKEISIMDLAQLVVKKVKSRSQIVLNSPATYNLEDDPRRRCPDITKAKSVLGFGNKVDLEGGIEKTAEWMRKNILSAV